MGVVTVVLEKVTNIVDKDRLGRSDPFIKFELEKDRALFDKGFGDKKSSKKKNTLNPEYNEIFVFEDVPSLNKMQLKVKIMDNDIGFDDRIGYAEIDLDQQEISETPKSIQVVAQCKNGAPTIFLKVSFIDA